MTQDAGPPRLPSNRRELLRSSAPGVVGAKNGGGAPPAVDPDVPDFRRAARPTAEVEQDRPREVPPWFGPVVGIISFLVTISVGLFGMSAWFQHLEATKPPPPTVQAPPTDVEGVQVRKGLTE